MDEITPSSPPPSAAVLAILDELVHTRATFPDAPARTRTPHDPRPHRERHLRRHRRRHRPSPSRHHRHRRGRRHHRDHGSRGGREGGRRLQPGCRRDRHRRRRQAADAGSGQPPHPPPDDPPARPRGERRPPGLPRPGLGRRGGRHGPRDRRAGGHPRRARVAPRRLHDPARHVLPPRGRSPWRGRRRQPARHRPGLLRRARARRPHLGGAPRRTCAPGPACSTRSAARRSRSAAMPHATYTCSPDGFAEVVTVLRALLAEATAGPPHHSRLRERRRERRHPRALRRHADRAARPCRAGSSPTCPSSSATACTSARATATLLAGRAAPRSGTARARTSSSPAVRCGGRRCATSGIRLGLGTDGCSSSNDLDMWQAMRQAALLARLTSGRPDVASAAEVLRAATIEGARALGLGDVDRLGRGRQARRPRAPRPRGRRTSRRFTTSRRCSSSPPAVATSPTSLVDGSRWSATGAAPASTCRRSLARAARARGRSARAAVEAL